ncbi:hypothetical protein [Chryseobacterium indoltheticum]|uniref:hypothetical protein n=1 Tax=Chryseobacterium indoltheticum TaxID=254 RepID=UPI003F490EDE
MKKLLLIFFLSIISNHIFSQDYKTINNIHYYDEKINKSDVYINERCVLDVYVPTNIKNFSTIIWFHGGGITGGQKEIPEELKK